MDRIDPDTEKTAHHFLVLIANRFHIAKAIVRGSRAWSTQ